MEGVRLYRVDDSMIFAVQIPDDSVGCSGSRCSNCDGAVAYCEQICKHCYMPLIGPTCLPQIDRWRLLSREERKVRVKFVFGCKDHGRHGYANVLSIPLTEEELNQFEKASPQDQKSVQRVHGVSLRTLQCMWQRRERNWALACWPR